MAIVLYHHPYTRASNVVWMLEEIGEPYELRFLDVTKGAHKAPEIVALNPMGKVPILVDGDALVTESAAIALYLGDRYAYGRLCPHVDDPKRGTYYRWILYAPSVIEPGSIAKGGGWPFRDAQAGWGQHDAMLTTIERALANGPFLLGETFSMADIVFGGTLRFMLRFDMLEARTPFTAYVERLGTRHALQRADARNAAIAAERGLDKR